MCVYDFKNNKLYFSIVLISSRYSKMYQHVYHVWLAVSINAYGDLELRSRRFHFDLVYFENLERRIKCNLINPFRERLLRNSTSNPYGDFELRSSRFRLQLYVHVDQYNCILM